MRVRQISMNGGIGKGSLVGEIFLETVLGEKEGSQTGGKMKRIFTILIVLVTIIIGIITYCYHSINYALDQSNFKASALALIEKHARLSLPVGSQGLNMYYDGFEIDPSFVAKIEIPSNSEMVLKSQIEKIKDLDYQVTGALYAKTAWWKPDKDNILAERKYIVESSFVHLILCPEKGGFVLYVEWISF